MDSEPPAQGFNGRRAQQYRMHVAAALCLLLSAFMISPAGDYLTRLGGDFLTPVAVRLASSNQNQTPSQVVVIVIDEITHNTPPFNEMPEVAWTPHLGAVIRAVDDAEPAVIGLDMIYPKSMAGRDLAPGYDRAFLQSLAKAGRSGGLVLSETRLSETPIRPYAGQEIAVGGADNIRPVHLTPDPDNVVRRHPATLALENGEHVRSFAAEISARMGKPPSQDILIDFVTPREQFSAYRFSDIYDCIAAGKTHGFDLFSGKAVLIGAALDIEDRHVAGNRLQRKKDFPVLSSPCGMESVSTPTSNYGGSIYRASTSGVFIEARAVHTFYSETAPITLHWFPVLTGTLIFLAILAAGFFRVGPAVGFTALVFVFAAIWAAAASLLAGGFLAPVLPLTVVGFLLFVVIYSYRVILEDQSKRWVTHAFRHYLSPSLVRQLADHPETLKLGGERRHVVVLFADLARFTTTSEAMADRPKALVAHLNGFFQIMSEKIEAHGGYIDKFIGDAVMGVWGAPVEIEKPERAAAEAALACVNAINAWNAKEGAGNDLKIEMRIGLSAGEVIAGNLGSKDRFNYTVIGDAVNRAARLEQENKRHKTQILIDGAIADCLPECFGARFVKEAPLPGQKIATKIYALDTAIACEPPNDTGENP